MHIGPPNRTGSSVSQVRWCTLSLRTGSEVNSFNFWKSKMADSCHLENRRYLRNGSTNLREIWHDDAHWASEPDRKLKCSTFKNPRWQTAAILKIGHISKADQPIFAKFGTMTHIGPPNRTGSLVSQLWAFMFVVHTLNCYGQNCTRRAIFRLGIDTLIANILVSSGKAGLPSYHVANVGDNLSSPSSFPSFSLSSLSLPSHK